MRTISRTNTFKRDYKREKKGRYRKTLNADLIEIVVMLAADEALPLRYHDHSLGGEWKDHSDCHIKPNLILIYRKKDKSALDLYSGRHHDTALPGMFQQRPAARHRRLSEGAHYPAWR